ncbi:MAG: hypothetical protein ACREBJ_10430, partial [Nitrosotalea sp.]
LKTFLCYRCGYSIDDCILEDEDLLKSYERLFYKFSKILKPTELSRYQPTGNTDNNNLRGKRILKQYLY